MKQVLVLEDDEQHRSLCEDMLEMKTNDVEVDCAGSVDEIEEFDYDTIITDYSGVDTETLYDEFDGDVVVFTGFDEHHVDMPENAEYVQKGQGYDKIVEMV